MNHTTEQLASRRVDHQAKSAGFLSAEEKATAEEWLERHKGREALLLGIASLLRRLDNLPKSR